MLYQMKAQYRIKIPFNKGGNLISWLYDNGKVLNVEYDEAVTIMDVELYKDTAEQVLDYIVEVRSAGSFQTEE